MTVGSESRRDPNGRKGASSGKTHGYRGVFHTVGPTTSPHTDRPGGGWSFRWETSGSNPQGEWRSGREAKVGGEEYRPPGVGAGVSRPKRTETPGKDPAGGPLSHLQSPTVEGGRVEGTPRVWSGSRGVRRSWSRSSRSAQGAYQGRVRRHESGVRTDRPCRLWFTPPLSDQTTRLITPSQRGPTSTLLGRGGPRGVGRSDEEGEGRTGRSGWGGLTLGGTGKE